MNIKKYFLISKTLVFKRWQHQNYSVFNTLHRHVKIGMLGLAYFTCLGYMNTFAQTDTASIANKIRLAEVQVTAHRAPSLYSEVGRLITVVPRSEIEALPVQSVQGLLKYMMNVDVRERGPLGVQADLSLRGGSFDQVMVLLNGVNITDPQTGHHNLNLPVDLNSIDRIEIIEGPASRVHGPNAFSGAINIITGTLKNNKVSVNTMAGENGLYNVGATLNHNIGKTTSYLSASKGGSDGYIDNTDFDVLNLFYQLRYIKEHESLNFQTGYTNKAFGANSFYTATYPNQFEQTRTFFSSLGFETGKTIQLKPNVYWRRHHDRFELFRNSENAAGWYGGHNYHMTDVFGGNINATIPWKLGKTSVGGEVRSENIWSNNIGIDMDEPLDVPGESGKQFTKSYHRSNTSLFLEHNLKIGNLSVSGGVMANFNSGLDYHLNWFPGVDVSYWISPRLKWMASYNQSLRMPTFTDLFYDGPTNVGNPDLEPEEASTIESGVKYVSKVVSGHINGFYRKGENLIDWGRQTGEEEYTTSNVNEINAYGIEVSTTVFPKKLGVPLIEKLDLNYAWLDQDKNPEEGYESVYVLNHLKHKFNLGVQHDIVKNISARWNFLFQDRVGSFTRSSDDALIEYKPVWLTDLRITWHSHSWRVFAEATNLFDKKYYDMGELERPGRWIKAGVQFSVGY
ncbi:TonB-dependent receptor [Marinilabilia rubra]|uniref:Vitamin B12 receptor n=1 Tax=Marinilabilia rubra TaxID=2162893 RepID=A0A2U2BAN3_9BACT|nr:TonB-dependent receptor [Marinilabilia rubra]PWE00122.1 vitamin B12 receptor [Marinilabilia rubra]